MEYQSLVTIENEMPLADSREIAQELGIEHRSFFKLITDYEEEVSKDFGEVRFEIAVGYRPQGGGNPLKYAKLTEEQAYVYLAYAQNTERAREGKRKLVKAFMEAKAQLAQREVNAVQIPPAVSFDMSGLDRLIVQTEQRVKRNQRLNLVSVRQVEDFLIVIGRKGIAKKGGV